MKKTLDNAIEAYNTHKNVIRLLDWQLELLVEDAERNVYLPRNSDRHIPWMLMFNKEKSRRHHE